MVSFGRVRSAEFKRPRGLKRSFVSREAARSCYTSPSEPRDGNYPSFRLWRHFGSCYTCWFMQLVGIIRYPRGITYSPSFCYHRTSGSRENPSSIIRINPDFVRIYRVGLEPRASWLLQTLVNQFSFLLCRIIRHLRTFYCVTDYRLRL